MGQAYVYVSPGVQHIKIVHIKLSADVHDKAENEQ